MYCKALTGVDVGVKPSEELASKGVGWVDESSPTTEGTTIYLPQMVERYQTKEDNFSVYKVFATHQAGRLEFGSFEYQQEREPQVFEPSNGQTATAVATAPPLAVAPSGSADGAEEDPIAAIHTDMELFFDRFGDRRLAHDLFTIVEDTRIDTIGQARIRRRAPRAEPPAAGRRRPAPAD